MPLIEPGQDISAEIIKSIQQESIDVEDGDIFAIAQKIISKSENSLPLYPLKKIPLDVLFFKIIASPELLKIIFF